MHVMLDLETMGKRPDAAIVAIGAVKFDPDAMVIGDTFYRVVDLESAVRDGGRIDPATLLWWLKQGEQARSAITHAGHAHPIQQALFELSILLCPQKGNEDVYVWGNGADFDNIILAEAYRRSSMAVPWPYWNNRCYRTLKGICPEIKIERSGTHHNALDDAHSQAEHLLRILRHLKPNDVLPRDQEPV